MSIMLMQMLVYGLANSVMQVVTFGQPYGIVADKSEWECYVSTTGMEAVPKLGLGTGVKYITGQSKIVPMSFDFFQAYWGAGTQGEVLNRVQNILIAYAKATNSVFSNVALLGDEKTYFIVTGCFLDNTSPGNFSIYILPKYVMFVQLRSDLSDELSSEALMQTAFDLITPLYSPKQLSAKLGIDLQTAADCVIIED